MPPGCTCTRFPIGTRVAIDSFGGYIPIGFFQLWHAGSTEIKKYPEVHGNAARTDMQFALQWPRTKRSFLPELVVYHLESEPAPMGANWNGRKTKTFDQAGGPHYGGVTPVIGDLEGDSYDQEAA